MNPSSLYSASPVAVGSRPLAVGSRPLVVCAAAGIPALGPSGASAHLRGVARALGAPILAARRADHRGEHGADAGLEVLEVDVPAWPARLGRVRELNELRIARRVAQTMRNFSHAGALRDCVFRPRMVLGLTDIPDDATLLSVVHGTTRGARKAIQDAIFDAGASNLSTAHMDLDDFGVAIDLLALDRPLSERELYTIRERAEALTGTPGVVRSLRQI